MSYYLAALAVICAVVTMHAAVMYWSTREWFYGWSIPLFALSTIILGVEASYVIP